MFDFTSRYYSLPLLKLKLPDGREIAYVSRRFLPPGGEFDLVTEHHVKEADRLDNLAAQYLDDPEQFWRIADANEAMSPFDLTETVGQTIRITLPQGIPGPRRA